MSEVCASELKGIERTEALAGLSKNTVSHLGSRLTWKMSIAQARRVRIAATWNGWNMIEAFWRASVRFKFKCHLFEAIMQGALCSEIIAFARTDGTFFVGAEWPREPEQAREANCGSDVQEQEQPRHEDWLHQGSTSKARNTPRWNGAEVETDRVGAKDGEAGRKERQSPDQVLQNPHAGMTKVRTD